MGNGVKIASVEIWDKILNRHFRKGLTEKGHLNKDSKERKEEVMQTSGRVFQAEETTNANAPRHECAWNIQGRTRRPVSLGWMSKNKKR